MPHFPSILLGNFIPINISVSTSFKEKFGNIFKFLPLPLADKLVFSSL
jgi:hypothetical protein